METVMWISSRLSSHLDQHDAHYEICAHEPSRSNAQTDRTAHVLLRQLAKSVIMEGGDLEPLLRMSHKQFYVLMSTAQHGHFCNKALQ
jgi:hypothetical protein